MKEIVKPIAVLAAICLVVTALLAYINSVTSPIIAKAEKEAAEKAQQDVLKEANGFEEITDIAKPDGVTKMVKATNGAGYVFTVESKGYGGKMELICGIKADGSLESVQTLTHNETGTVGGEKVVNNSCSYRENFVGKTADNYDKVDTVASATISSNAYKKAIGNAFSAYEAVTKEATK